MEAAGNMIAGAQTAGEEKTEEQNEAVTGGTEAGNEEKADEQAEKEEQAEAVTGGEEAENEEKAEKQAETVTGTEEKTEEPAGSEEKTEPATGNEETKPEQKEQGPAAPEGNNAVEEASQIFDRLAEGASKTVLINNAAGKPDETAANVGASEPEEQKLPDIPQRPDETAAAPKTAEPAKKEPTPVGQTAATAPVDPAAIPLKTEPVTAPEAADKDKKDDSGSSNLSEIPYLQKMINDAMTAVLKGRITVVLSKNTNYQGDIEITAGAKSVADDFELELVAEDAGGDGISGNGYTIIEGNVTIRGVRVVMNSIVMGKENWIKVVNAGNTAGDNSSRGGDLEFNGTTNFNTTVNVEVGSKSSAELNFEDANEKIGLKTDNGAKSVVVNAGDGINVINAEIHGGDVTITSAGNSDTLNLTTSGNNLGDIRVDTGGGIDELTIVHNGAAADGKTVEISSGAGDDRVNVDVRENAGDITIETGLGGDVISVTKGNHHAFESIEYNLYHNPNEKFRAEGSTATLTFVNSDPDAYDHVTIDVIAAGAVSKVAFKGGKGANVHLKGTLKTDPKDGTHQPIRWLNGDIELTAFMASALSAEEIDRTLTLNWQKTAEEDGTVPTYIFTDALKNKRQVYLYAMGDNVAEVQTRTDKKGKAITDRVFTFDGAVDDFTDYVVRTPVNNLYRMTITGSDHPLMLSNLVINTDLTLDSFKDSFVDDDDDVGSDNDHVAWAGYLNVPNITALNMNVLLQSNTVQLKSGRKIKAQNVRMEAISGTKMIGQAFNSLTRSGEGYDSWYESAEDIAIGAWQTASNMFSVYDRSRINVNGTIEAAHNIEMLARVKHFGRILGVWPAFLNVINIKVGDADVIIGKNARLTAEDNILADAKIETITGMDYTADPNDPEKLVQVKSGSPVAVTVVVNNADVTVKDGAIIKGKAGDILLNSESKITTGDYAIVGSFSSPFALSGAVIFNYVNTYAEGELTAGRKIELRARGDVTAESETIKDAAYTSASGYFAALNILEQDVTAKFGEYAKAVAGQDVRIDSAAKADIDTLAKSGGMEQGSTEMGTSIGNFFMQLFAVIKPKIGLSLKIDEVQKVVAKVAAGSFEVKSVNLSPEQEDRGSVTVNTYVNKTQILENDYIEAIVEVAPKDGYVIDKVEYRYMNPGEDHYTYGTARKLRSSSKDNSGAVKYRIKPTTEYTEVIVTFREKNDVLDYDVNIDENANAEELNEDDLEEVIKLDGLVDNALKGLDDDEDEDEFQELKEDEVVDEKRHNLYFESMTGGSVLTWLTGKDQQSLRQVQEGQKIRLVPNPDEGMQVDSLTVTYTTKEDVVYTMLVKADKKGVYSFTVPEDVKVNGKFTVNATFTGKAAEQAAPEYKQTSGAIALTWVRSESNAQIDENASVVGKNGNVEMMSVETTDANTVADGTGVTKNVGAKKKDEPAEKLCEQGTRYQVGEALYAIRLTSNVKGAVTGTIKRSDGANALMPVFTIIPPEGADISKTHVVLSYYSEIDMNMFGGTMRTQEFSGKDFTKNGNIYTLKANLNSTTIFNGEIMDVSFLFVDADGNPLADTTSNTEYLIRNPIATKVNELRLRDSDGQYKPETASSVGELLFVKAEERNGHTVYAFNLSKQNAQSGENAYRGYSIDDSYDVNGNSNSKVLYATWKDENGNLQKAPLKHYNGSTYWYLDPQDGSRTIPEGVLITVVAVFSEDLRPIETKMPIGADGKAVDHGTVSYDKKQAKMGDKVTVTLKAKDGYVPAVIILTWVSGKTGEGQQTLEVSERNSKGDFVFTMPWVSASGTLYVSPRFSTKTVELKAGDGIKLSESGKGYGGENITVTPAKKETEAGKKVTKLTVTFTYENGNTETKTYSEAKFTIPVQNAAGSAIKSVSVKAELGNKKYQIEATATGYGKLVPAVPWADPGEKVQIKVEPKEGYRVKSGTLKAQIRAGSSESEILLKRVDVNLYEFTLPYADDIKDISFRTEFEAGTDDIERSLGASLAVAMVKGDNNVEIDEDAVIVAGGSLTMTGLANGGKATTEAKAGFNAGISGIAGGIAVQIGLFKNDVIIHEGAALKIGTATEGGGALDMLAKSSATFKVTGNALGNMNDKGGTESGVGAGIAFAVDNVTDNAIVEDGVMVDDSSKFSSISVNANHKTKDTMKATAGAAGGTSTVPVLAVDLFKSKAYAELGKVEATKVLDSYDGYTIYDDDKKDLTLEVAGKVNVKAKSESAQVTYNHEVIADASAVGKGSAKGAALMVTWLRTDVDAKLKNPVNAGGNITVSATAGDALNATANASAAGGYEGRKTKSGKGSADKQANGVLENAAQVGGQQGAVDGANVMNDIKGRQLAETSETSVTGAGAFILNIHKNQSNAEIVDGVDVSTTKKLAVQSMNRVESKVKANASATKSDEGMGIGAAVSIVTMDNIARIGNGKITAGELLVEAKLATVPPEIRTLKNVQNSSTMQSELEAALEEMIRDLVGDDVYETIGSGANKFISTFWAGLVRDLNLQQLMDILDDKGTAGLMSAFDVLEDRVVSFPKTLIEPYKDTINQAVDGIENFDADNFKDFLVSELTTQLFSKGYQAFAKSLYKEGSDAIFGSLVDMMTNKLKGKPAGGSVVKDKLKAAITKSFKVWADSFFDDFQVKLETQFPVLNASNKEAIRKLVKDLKNLTMKEVGVNLLSQFTDTFRKEIYDYEPVVTQIQSKGFTTFVKDELLKLLKESTAAMTNEVLDNITDKLDVRFERVPVDDRHVIVTQAIAGAGAKGKSTAGSVAVAVTDLTTKAEIKDSGKTVTVNNDGALTINAEELRRIWTHATAAVDAKDGEVNNNGSGENENRDNGGSSADNKTITSDDNSIVVTTNTSGGSARFDSNGTDVVLIPAPGYKLTGSSQVQRTYTLEDGTEMMDDLFPEPYGDDYTIQPMTGVDMTEMPDGGQIHIFVTFEPDMRSVPAVTLINDGDHPGTEEYNANGGNITLGVAEGDSHGKTTKAKTNDLVEIRVKRVKGLVPDEIYVYVKDENEPVRKYKAGGENVTIRESSANEEEATFVFKMPEEDVERIEVQFSGKYDPEAEEEPVETKNASGESVGRGGAFAWTWGDSVVKSEIGTRGTAEDTGVTAGSVAVTAYSEHGEQNFSTAGSDPFAGTSNDTKDAGTDVALSLNMLDNDIVARIAKDTAVKITGTPAEEEEEKEEDGEEEEEEIAERDIAAQTGDLLIHATEYSANETKASAFATGSTSAIGASVSVNISESGVEATLGGNATLNGKAVIRSFSENQDRTWSFASAMGADVQRTLNKMADATDKISQTASGVADGSVYNEKAKKNDPKKNTKTSNKIADGLNKNKDANGQEAVGNLPVSGNVARSQNVEVDNAEDADGEAGRGKAESLVKDNTGMNAPTTGTGQKKKKLQAAAAIGFTVTNHSAKVKVGGSINAGKDIELSTMNAGNFNTRSTAASITLEDMGKGKSISAAIGVSIDKNKSTIDVGGKPFDDEKDRTANLVSTGGNVTVDAETTQNLTGVFRGYLAVQSISGAVSGKNASGSIAGSVSLIFSSAETAARIRTAKTSIEGDEVTIRANDKSKLAARAGAVSVSKGASVGAGVSAVLIWAGNEVDATLSKDSTVTANSFDLTARKQKVTFDDYKFPLDLSALISDSSELTEEQRQNTYTGLIDIHREPGKQSYKVDINLDTYALMQLPDMWNFLASQNYYTEAIAGSVITGGMNNDFNGAGAFSVVRAKNKVKAELGDNVTIQRKTEGQTDGQVNVSAQGDTTVRMIGGAVSVGAAKTSAGMTVTFLYDQDNVKATMGDGLKITDAGDVKLSAKGGADVDAFNAAVAVGTSYNAKFTMGGGLNILLLENTANTTIGDSADINANGKLDITADSDMDLTLISVSAAGAKNNTAAGGTLAFVFDEAKSKVKIGDNHVLNAVNDVTLRGKASDDMLSILPSASGATTGTAVAGVLNVLDSSVKGEVELGSGTGGITSTAGSVSLLGKTDTRAINVTVAGAVSTSGNGVGMSVNINIFDRDSKVDIGGGSDYTIDAAKDVLSVASGDDTTIMAAMAVSAGAGLALTGNGAFVIGKSRMTNTLGDGTVTAGGEAAFTSHLRDRTYDVEGNVAASTGGSAIGASYMFLLKENTVKTDLGYASITAKGRAGTLAAKVPGIKEFEGLYVGARVQDTIVAVEAGVVYGSGAGITANLLNANNDNQVEVDASNASLTAMGDNATGGSATVEAMNDSSHVLIAGGINASSSVAGGAGIVTLYAAKNVKAKVNDVKADRNVSVNGVNKENIVQMNVNAGGAGTAAIEVGASLQVLSSKVTTTASGDIRSEYGQIDLASHNDVDIVNATVAVGGAGVVAVTPVVVLQFFTGSSEANLKQGNVWASKGLKVQATSDKTIDQFTIGIGGAGFGAVSGGVTIQSLKDSTMALVGENAVIERAEKMEIDAHSNYSLLGVSGIAAGAIGAALSVNAMITIMKANTLAEMEGTATIVGGPLELRATSNRKILDVGANASLGLASLGITLSGLVSGTKMDQDQADMLVYGQAEEGDEKTFDVSGLKKFFADKRKELSISEKNMSTDNLDGLQGDIEGNGEYDKDMNIGKDGVFDAEGAAVDDTVYEQRGEVDESATDGEDENDDQVIKDNMEDKELGRNADLDETEDLKNVKTLGGSVHDNMPSDAVVARIGSNAVITRSTGVTVEAIQGTEADVVAGTISVGILGGAAAGAAFALLHSNVSASSMGDLQDVNNGEVRVKAVSASGRVNASEEGFTHSKAEALAGGFSSDYNEANRNEAVNAQVHQGDKSEEDKKNEDIQGGRTAEDDEEKEDNQQGDVKIERASLRVIGISAMFSGEDPGPEKGHNAGAVVLGVIRSDNVTQAMLGNNVTNASLVNVNSVADYKDIFALTIGAHFTAGPAVSASIAVATSEGTVKAALDSSAYITGSKTNVNVTTDSDTTVTTFAATIAASMSDTKPTKAGGLSIAINKLNQKTAIYQGAVIETEEGGDVNVQADSDTTGQAYLISGVGSIGFTMGLNGSIVYVRPTVNTSVGIERPEVTEEEAEEDDEEDGEDDEEDGDEEDEEEEEEIEFVVLSGLNNVNVKNNVDSAAKSGVLSVNVAGMASIQGNVLLVFNDTKATARMANASLDVGNLTIEGELGAKGDSKFLAVTAGTAAVGATVAYVDVNSRNNAELDTSNLRGRIQDTLTVASGIDESKKTKAVALGIAAQIGKLFTVGINVTVAKNRAENNATITGTRSLNVPTVNVQAEADGTARTRMYGLSLAMTATIAATAESVQNEATSRATVRLGGTVNGNLNVSSKTTGSTKGYMLTGSGSLVGVVVNVAIGYGKTRSLVDVELAEAPDEAVSISAINTGNQDDVDIDINNLNLNKFSVVTLVGLGYNQDVYQTRVKLGQGYQLSSLTAKTGYDNTTDVYVTPSAAGLDVAAVKIMVNVSKAENTVDAGTSVEFTKAVLAADATEEEKEEAAMLENAEVNVEGDLTVETTGTVVTESEVRTAIARVTGAQIGVSVAHANLSARQAAMMYLDGVDLTVGGELKVRSISNGAESSSSVGSTGKDEEAAGLEISIVDVGVNSAKSWENLDSTAGIMGNGKDIDSIQAARLDINAENASGQETKAFARTTNGVELKVVSGGALLSQAISTDSYNAILSGVKATISGKAYITAKTNSMAEAIGAAPGGLSGVKVSYTEMKAYMGDEDDRQTAKVLIGDNTELNTTGSGSDIFIQAENKGEVKADMDAGISIVVVIAIQVSKMPTVSYYDTGVLIGKNSEINSSGRAVVESTTKSKAISKMDAKTFVGGINAQHMKGTNSIYDTNIIDLGAKSKIIAAGEVRVKGTSNTQAEATSDFAGGAILVSGERLQANNWIRRDVIMNIADGAQIQSTAGEVKILNVTGEEDWIYTASRVGSGSVLFNFNRADVRTLVQSNNEIRIGSGVQIDSAGNLTMIARASSQRAPGVQMPDDDDIGDTEGAAIYSYAKAVAGSAIIPTYAVTEVELKLNTLITINRGASGAEAKTALKANAGDINIFVSNNGFNIKAEGIADASGIGGNSTGKGGIETDIKNTLWVDNSEVSGWKVTFLAGDERDVGAVGCVTKPAIRTWARSELNAIGRAAINSSIKGQIANQVRSNNIRFVTTNTTDFFHKAYDPLKIVTTSTDMNLDAPLAVHDITHGNFWKVTNTAFYRCDFCEEGASFDINPYRLTDTLAGSIAKAMSPVNEINRKADEARVLKARYGEEDNTKSEELYVLDVESLLEEDIVLTDEQMNKYVIWTNSETFQTVQLLPNATRLHSISGRRLQYVSDVLEGDVFEDGNIYEIDVITALTGNAVIRPVLSVGSTGSLNFQTGELTLPSRADFELYLHEVSAGWLLGKLQTGTVRRMTADQDAINNSILNGEKLPAGTLTDGLTDGVPAESFLPIDPENSNLVLYWLGHTPETAETADEVLIGLLVNPETDEIDAFRTSPEMIEAGEELIDVSLYVFRDRIADKKGQESYNVFFFDTPAGEKSLVKLYTAVPGEENVVTPRRLIVVLRARRLEGADFPVYSLTDHYFALCDGTDGEVSMFGDFYHAELRNDTFESNYIRIDGVSGGYPQVTVKKDQTIWPEWTGKDTAEDIGGKKFERVDDVWYKEDNTPVISEEEQEKNAG